MAAFADAALGRALDAWLYLRLPRIPRRHWLARGELPAIAFPRSYCDRIQWRKLFDRNPLFVTFADKLAAKEYVARHRPGLAMPRLRWVGTDIAAAPDDALAGDCVVKANHGSNMNLFIRDGRHDRAELGRITRGWMAESFGRVNGEWAYRQIPRRLFIEEMLPAGPGGLVEINIRAARGRYAFGNLLLHAKTPRQSAVYLDRHGARRGTLVGAGMDPAELDRLAVPDAAFREAVDHAMALSAAVDFARFDFFWSEGRLYAGEITIYPQSGYAARNPLEHEVMALWDLRESWFMQAPLTGWRALYRRALLRHLERTGQ